MCEAFALSGSLFASLHALACAEAQLHEQESERKEVETCIVFALVHAMRVAHAACEAALTRIEPLYDAAVRDAAEYALCNEMVASALENATMIVSALEYASTQLFLSVDVCGDAAMRAAIDAESIGAVALGVVLLSEFPSIVAPRGLFVHALRCTRVDILRMLLSSPALVAHIIDRDPRNNNTLLMLPSVYGNIEAITALLACPAVVASACVVNNYEHTALMLASYHGYTESVKALLACSTVIESVSFVDADGDTALQLAVLRGHVETVTALLLCSSVVFTASVANNDGCTALMLAAARGHTGIVTALLACSPVIDSIGVVNADGYTALMLASNGEHVETVTALLACPAVVATAGVVDNYGSTALMLAVMRRHVETVEALLGCPAVVATMGVVNNGFTVLMIAEQTGHARMVQLLRACNE
jgi:ankyrin repeat protein